MNASIRSEFLKVVTTRAWWILALVLVVYVGFTVSIFAFLFGLPSGDPSGVAADQLFGGASAVTTLVGAVSSVGYVFPLLIGSLLVTAEYRHKTLVPTYLATPRRGRVLVAKNLVGLAVGALYGLVGVAAALAIGGVILEILKPGSITHLDAAVALRVVVALAVWAVIGVGVGALVRNQIAAIVIVLVFTQFVEPILRLVSAFWDWSRVLGEYLPGAASDAFVGSSIMTGGTQLGAGTTLEWWGAGLVLLGYAVLFVVLAWLLRLRADVD